jgi:hypothetical protein
LSSPRYFEAFAGFATKSVYNYWFGTYRVQGLSPKPSVSQIATEMRRYRDQGVLGIHGTSGGEVWGLEGPAYYAYGKLAWNPDRDIDEVLDTYCRGVYRAAAPAMKGFFRLLHERIAVGDAMQTPEERRLFLNKGRPEVYFPAAYPVEILTRLESLLQEARERAADDPIAGGWLRFTELQFRHVRITAMGFHLYRQYEAARTPETGRQLAAILQERETFLQELEALKNDEEYLRNWFPGWQLYTRDAASGGRGFGRIDQLMPFRTDPATGQPDLAGFMP